MEERHGPIVRLKRFAAALLENRNMKVSWIDIPVAKVINATGFSSANCLVLNHDVANLFPLFINGPIAVVILKDVSRFADLSTSFAEVLVSDGDDVIRGNRREELNLTCLVVDVIILPGKLKVEIPTACPLTALIVSRNTIVNINLFAPLLER